MRLLTTCWGDNHIEMFKNACLKSMSWRDNAHDLEILDSTWNIYTDEHNVESLKSYCESQINIKFNVESTTKLRAYTDQVQSAFIKQIEECLKEDEPLLLAPPDTIFAEGSVIGLYMAGREKNSVVMSPHPRVLPKITESLNSAYNKPHDMVKKAWEYLHDSWVHAEDGHHDQSSYVGGVTWKKNQNLIYVKHLLPTPYLINFTAEDLEYFKSAISVGHIDHQWPSDILIPRGRQRYLASSDAAFMVEITDEDKNIPPILAHQPKTGFWKDNVQSRHNNQIISVFRS